MPAVGRELRRAHPGGSVAQAARLPNYKFLPLFAQMTVDLKQLLAARTELDAQIAQARALESKAALAQIHAWIEDFGFTAQQVFPWKPPASNKVAAKFEMKRRAQPGPAEGSPPPGYKVKTKMIF